MYKIYGAPGCVWCKRAVDLAHREGLDYEYIDISMDREAADMLKAGGFRTIPQVFFEHDEGNLVHIGGFKEFDNEIRQSKRT